MIKTLVLLLMPCYVLAAEIENDENQALWVVLQQIQSPSGSVEAILYRSTEEKNRNIWWRDTYLEITAPSGGWRIDPQAIEQMIGVLEFIDDERLLIEFQSITSARTAILNIGNGETKIIGGGGGQYIREGADQGLIRLGGKGYADGAYWYSVIVDFDGRVVEVLSEVDTNCLPIREILNLEKKPATLRQSLDECIGVVR